MSRRKVLHCFLAIATLAVSTLWLLWRTGILRAPSVFVRHFDGLIDQVPDVAAMPWQDGPVDRLTALAGQSLEKIQEQFGRPNQEYEFSMGGSLDEFRCELMNKYPPGSIRSIGVRIKEWQWRYRGFTVAVWFHQSDGEWVVLDTCRWKDGIAF